MCFSSRSHARAVGQEKEVRHDITKQAKRRGRGGGRLVAGIVSGGLLQLMHMTTMEGLRQPAMALVAGAVHTTRPLLAWAGYLVYAALIGAAFGWLTGRQDVGEGAGVVWGVLYGAFWWIVSGLVVIPVLYGVGPLTSAAVDVIRNASLPWFAAMLLNGGVLGGVYPLLAPRRSLSAAGAARETRRAA